MYTDKIKLKLEQADQFLEAAQNEMFRSAEDVVPHMACSSARQSIYNYLQGFLLKHGIEYHEATSLEELLNQCQKIDSKFDSFDLSLMPCRTQTHDENYCTELQTVEKCIGLAAQAKNLVVETNRWPESKHIK